MTVKYATTLFITLLVIICLSDYVGAAPTGKITGQVINTETGEPIIGASVFLVGTKRGAVTDFDGKYIIGQIEPGTYTLKITHLDFATVTIEDVVVTLDNDTEAPNSSVKRKSELGKLKTIADVRVPKENFNGRPSTGLYNLLKQVTGIVTNQQGEIFIRGGRANEVAYVVDGPPIIGPLGGLGQAGANISFVKGEPATEASERIIGVTHSLVTDEDGRFLIEGPPNDTYEVIISTKGYETVKIRDISIIRNRLTNFSHSLEKIK